MDAMLAAACASPAKKAATLARESRVLAVAAQNALAEAPPASNAEVLVRGTHDCWVAARRVGPR